MNTKKIKITEADRMAAMKIFMNAPVIHFDQALQEYKATLDEYCVRFKAANHHELMFRADESEFEFHINCEILDKYSFLERHKIE